MDAPQEGLTGAGQPHRAAAVIDQRGAKGRFERLDLLAHGRLRQSGVLGGLRDSSAGGQRFEDLKAAQSDAFGEHGRRGTLLKSWNGTGRIARKPLCVLPTHFEKRHQASALLRRSMPPPFAQQAVNKSKLGLDPLGFQAHLTPVGQFGRDVQ